MSIKLSKETESRFIMDIAEGLQTVVLTHGYVTFPSLKWVDSLQSALTDDDRNKLDRFCGEPGLKKFVYSELGSDLQRLSIESSPPSQKLIELQPFHNTIPYARQIVGRLQCVPKRFRATVALPAEISEPIVGEVDEETSFKSDIKVLTGSKLPTSLPVHSRFEKVDRFLFHDFMDGTDQVREIVGNRMYFTMSLVGYASISSASELCRTFEDYLKAFYGAGMAVALFNQDWFFSNQDRLPYIMIHDADDQGELIATEKLEQELLQSDPFLSTNSFLERNKEDPWAAFNQVMIKIDRVFSGDTD